MYDIYIYTDIQRLQECIFRLPVKPSVALKLFEQYGCPKTCAPLPK